MESATDSARALGESATGRAAGAGRDARESQLDCPRCGLTIEPRAPCLAIRYCPRCLARSHRIVELSRSALPGIDEL